MKYLKQSPGFSCNVQNLYSIGKWDPPGNQLADVANLYHIACKIFFFWKGALPPHDLQGGMLTSRQSFALRFTQMAWYKSFFARAWSFNFVAPDFFSKCTARNEPAYPKIQYPRPKIYELPDRSLLGFRNFFRWPVAAIIYKKLCRKQW